MNPFVFQMYQIWHQILAVLTRNIDKIVIQKLVCWISTILKMKWFIYFSSKRRRSEEKALINTLLLFLKYFIYYKILSCYILSKEEFFLYMIEIRFLRLFWNNENCINRRLLIISLKVLSRISTQNEAVK